MTATTSSPTQPTGAQASGYQPVTKTAHGLAIASLISQIGIIVTGGAVRLTKSGLGCSEWPRCTPETMTPTPEMGIHGLIEFGNRTLTFVLAAIAVAMIVAAWRSRKAHTNIFVLSWALLGIIPAQAVIGGITVLTKLNPWVVSLHFLASAACVALAVLLVNRTGRAYRNPDIESSVALKENVPFTPQPVFGPLRVIAATAWALAAWVIVMGTTVTGTGPHAGDESAPRHTFNALVVTRMHTVPVYVLTLLIIVGLVIVMRRNIASLKNAYLMTIGVILIQAGIGYWQHFSGLPIGLVLAHMLGSALLLSAVTNVWDRTVN
ncbi:heme A synthase [Pseudoglutamicibacter cumminsii]|uniref:COX15/CtaA family protein n=1 Tax=Pseudoglutamicibacter cumminsii TaxID=156979 RepID=UPI0021A5D983|nr:COX15/CtaA family protein [Pseudoglutamicibacter cumminsii]MCT1686842.1 COX15/CtaA family protein [Pseudoglutamicibacter cumminsii]MDK7082934.1 COX15/CtaA family protein [Pseudoglutamicibacter cumminsii]